MQNKTLKKGRMWKYFVEATVDIIDQEGIEHVTIRKIADRAGYNSATIYNYFTDITHLIFFASMKMLKGYTDDLAVQMENSTNSLEGYMIAWECFCKHSFQTPRIFHAVFIMDLGNHPEKLIQDYYEIYPSDLLNVPDELKSILFERSVTKRGKSILTMAANEGYLKEDCVDEINEMTNLIWLGMLTKVLNNRADYDFEEASAVTMKHVVKIVRNTQIASSISQVPES